MTKERFITETTQSIAQKARRLRRGFCARLAEIRKALESARVAVFLVTQNLLDSPFVREKELPVLVDAATNRGCLIFWIAVSSSTIEDSPLAKYQGAISPPSPLDLMTEPEQNKVLVATRRLDRRSGSVPTRFGVSEPRFLIRV